MKRTKKRAWICAAAVGAVLCLALFLGSKAERERADDYLLASEAEGKGDVSEAYRLYSSLGSYRDSADRASLLALRDPSLPCLTAQTGDIVCFGNYEQDGDARNGPEPIEWLVLETFEDRVLLLSLRCLKAGAYHDRPFAAVTWEKCALRTWLNGEFCTKAFSETEQGKILSVWNENEDQRALGTEGGNDTLDRVFLLSQTEAGIYLKNEESCFVFGRCIPSDSAAAAFSIPEGEETVPWWLRSPGVYEYSAQYVDMYGRVYESGAYTDIDYQFGIRPAIWIGLEETEEG